jgi:hypothetical protein
MAMRWKHRDFLFTSKTAKDYTQRPFARTPKSAGRAAQPFALWFGV